MSERFGIADHSPQLTQHAPQNPTPQTVYQPFSSGTDYSSSYSNHSSSGYSGTYVPVNTGPAYKGMIRAILLAMVFGPFGLFYVTWKGACILLLLSAAAIIILGGGLQGFYYEIVLAPVTLVARTVATVWALVACKIYNRKLRLADEAIKSVEDDT